jgi:hypothetical protein
MDIGGAQPRRAWRLPQANMKSSLTCTRPFEERKTFEWTTTASRERSDQAVPLPYPWHCYRAVAGGILQPERLMCRYYALLSVVFMISFVLLFDRLHLEKGSARFVKNCLLSAQDMGLL